MNSVSRFAVLLFCAAGAANAASSTDTLGIPLGQKIQEPIAPCPSQALARAASSPCWIKPPALSSGAHSGFLLVPASSAAQDWGSPGTYDVQIDADGILQAVSVHSRRAGEYARIRSALTDRFGKRPRASSAVGPRYMAWWKVDDVDVTLNCSADIGCNTRFSLDTGEDRRLQSAMDAGMR